ncbi:Aspartate aminotransferase [Candidatus Erwinia haradaeae]|uniref:Aspartate aminotransferase n=1 Tax=Candidatus Erwinia haradaeae TaxID=1922217 RepID=A0A451DCA5_9GAMM|nr:amino acid aminotransferase [Candidatus Erwinia haradaeae]VFP83993.1 Aspartate aminotransferase [Candidatus Erwinia haradaeae]
MFELITTAPKDPILDLNDAFHTDTYRNKINLGIGVYKDHSGKTPVLSSVKKAEIFLQENEKTKNYLNIEGLSSFGFYIQELLFGASNPLIAQKRIRTAQTPGGTGALRIAIDFLASQMHAKKKIWISNPSWPNYRNIFTAAGFQVAEYDYCNPITNTLNFEAMIDSLHTAQPGDIILLQGCCHNPTGIDPSTEQWKYLAHLSLHKGWLPIFDFAYQGFALGLEEDVKSLRTFSSIHPELIVCSSYSKNFSLYSERVGALSIIASHSKVADAAFSHIRSTIRANYSSPPSHGAAVVATILHNNDLRAEWKKELNTMRERIQNMRELLAKNLQMKTRTLNFDFLTTQTGMFSLFHLTPNQVLRLRNEFGVYVVPKGRINIAGITHDNISPICEALTTVL